MRRRRHAAGEATAAEARRHADDAAPAARRHAAFTARARHHAADVLPAAFFGVLSAAGADRPVLAALSALPLLWRRRFPVLVCLLTAAILIAQAALDRLPDSSPAVLLLAFTALSAALHAERARYAALGAGSALAGVTVLQLVDAHPTVPVDLVWAGFIVAGPAFAAWVVVSRTRRAASLRAGVRALEERRQAAIDAAIEDERNRVARELHDIVAHSVSIISVQASAAEYLIAHDRERALASMTAIADSADDALLELRRLLAALRGSDPDAGPQPGLEQLEELLATGARVRIDVRTDVATLPPGLSLAAYRIVQEALTNARKHGADGEALVRLRRDPGALVLEVLNPLRGTPDAPATGGHGLIGMRERARLYGGSVEAGPDGAGRWAVRAVLAL